jgi:hypothetical protein
MEFPPSEHLFEFVSFFLSKQSAELHRLLFEHDSPAMRLARSEKEMSRAIDAG